MRRSFFFFLLAAVVAAGLVRADPLDKVTGTEDWNRAAPEDLDAEWQEWYRGRVASRRGGRELRAQRAINARLARLLRSGAPSLEQVRRIIQTGLQPITTEQTAGPAGPAVPLERLDAAGQAIDEEGDRELQRVTKNKKGQPPAGAKTKKRKSR